MSHLNTIYNYIITFQADLNKRYRIHNEYKRVDHSNFINARSVFKQVTLTKGSYVVIPVTFDPGQKGKYILRMFCGKDLDAM